MRACVFIGIAARAHRRRGGKVQLAHEVLRTAKEREIDLGIEQVRRRAPPPRARLHLGPPQPALPTAKAGPRFLLGSLPW